MPQPAHFREQIQLATGFDNKNKAIILTLCATLFRVMSGWTLGERSAEAQPRACGILEAGFVHWRSPIGQGGFKM
jgi:hypothetical protein